MKFMRVEVVFDAAINNPPADNVMILDVPLGGHLTWQNIKMSPIKTIIIYEEEYERDD